MPIRYIQSSQVPGGGFRGRSSPVLRTSEWGEVMTKLQAGFRPLEAIEVNLTDRLVDTKYPNRAFRTQLRRWLKKRNMTGQIDVLQRGKGQDPPVFVVGAGPVVI